MSLELSRRGFVKLAGAGLVLGLAPELAFAAATGPFAPNPFVRIAPDSTVTVIVKHLDKGQGIATGLATLVAEELDADWKQMRAEFAPADNAKYKNLFFGAQGTGGSTSMANSFDQYRQAGAVARAMLVAAAAQAWSVPASEIEIAGGTLSHASGKSGTFGDFAEAAGKLDVPAKAPMKAAADYRLIGKNVHRLDTEAKITGQPIYTQDVHLDGMIVAAIIHPPRFGAVATSIDASKAKDVQGFLDARIVPQGVAVYGKSTWPAFKAKGLIQVVWDESKAEKRGSAEIVEEYKALAGTPGVVAADIGSVDAGMANAAKVIEQDFVFPFLAHAPMEPMNAVVQVKDGRATIWTGAQMPTLDQAMAARVLDLTPDKVDVVTKWAGGSFGRRAVPTSDYVVEAAHVAKAWGKPDPVKLVWQREDDMKAGYYRPAYLHRVKIGVDAQGNVLAWKHTIVGQSILAGTPFAAMVKNGVDATSVEGVSDLPYLAPNLHVELHTTKLGVPALWWRSVGHTHTAFVVETMIDRIAAEAGRDPVAYRLATLRDKPRHVAVLKLAAEKAGWGSPPPEGVFRGVAVHESFRTFVAHVVDVRMGKNGEPKVERVVCAVDCGLAVNPDIVKAQMEGGVGFGLGAALRDAITLNAGVVDQANFDTYLPLRISDMPKVEVHIVASAAPPTGVGEPGVPPLAPAVANAMFKATGRAVTELPLITQTAKGT